MVIAAALYSVASLIFCSLVYLLISSIFGVVGLFIAFQKNLVWRTIPKQPLSNKTYLIFGASLGLGKALSIEFAKCKPKKLILVSRGSTTPLGKNSLEELKQELSLICSSIRTIKLDICDSEKVSQFFEDLTEESIDWMIVTAGTCLPKILLEQKYKFYNDEENFQMNLNYFGSLNIVKALLASKYRPERLIFVGSLVSSGSFAGYSGYGASKYALKGLVDSIRNEFKAYNESNKMSVHLYLPGSIDSPGYEKENKLKPEATKKIEGTSSLASCRDAAKILIKGVLNDFYLIPSDFLGYIACISITGLSPRKYPFLESLALPLIGLISHIVAKDFDNTSAKELRKRIEEQDIKYK